MKTATRRKPFGTATFDRIRSVRYLSWEDAFEVEFDSGVSYLVDNADLRRRNGLPAKGQEVVATWVDPELRSGFYVRYANDETAEASWEFVKEEAG